MLIQRQGGGGGGGGGRSGGGYPILLRPCVRRTALIEGWMDGFSSWKNEISQQHQRIDIQPSLPPSLPPLVCFFLSLAQDVNFYAPEMRTLIIMISLLDTMDLRNLPAIPPPSKRVRSLFPVCVSPSSSPSALS